MTLNPNQVHYLCDTGSGLVPPTGLEEGCMIFGSFYVLGTLSEYRFAAIQKGVRTSCTLYRNGDTAVARTPYGDITFQLKMVYPDSWILLDEGTETEPIFEEHGYLLIGGDLA